MLPPACKLISLSALVALTASPMTPGRAMGVEQTRPEISITPRLGHAGDVTAISASPDGIHLATASDSSDGKVLVWNIKAGTVVGRFQGSHLGRVEFSSDGKRLAVENNDGVDYWKWPEGTLDRHINFNEGLPERIEGMSEGLSNAVRGFSPNLRYIVFGHGILDTEARKLVLKMEADSPISAVSFAREDRLVYETIGSLSGTGTSGGKTGKNIFYLNSFDEKPVLAKTGQLASLAGASAPGRILLMKGLRYVGVTNLITRDVKVLPRIENEVLGIAISPNGRLVAVSSWNGGGSEGDSRPTLCTVRIFDAQTGEEGPKPKSGPTACVHALTFGADGGTLFAASSSIVEAYRVADGSIEKYIGSKPERIHGIGIDATGTRLLVLHGDGDERHRLDIRDLRSFDLLRSHPVDGSLPALSVSQSGNRYAFTAISKATIAFEMSTGAPVPVMPAAISAFKTASGPAYSSALSFSSNGQRLYSASAKSRLWNNGKSSSSSKFQSTNPIQAVLSRDGSLLAMTTGEAAEGINSDQSLRLFDVEKEKLLSRIESYGGALTFSPDGTTLAVAQGSTIECFSVPSLKSQKSITIPNQPGGPLEINKMLYSANGERLYIGANAHGPIDVDLTTGAVHAWGSENGSAEYIVLSPDGARLYAGGGNGRVTIWDVGSRTVLASLVVAGDDWAIITPEGYFAASSSGLTLIQAQRASKVLSIENLLEPLYRPDLVRQRLAGDPDSIVRAAAAKLDLVKVLDSGSAPLIAFEVMPIPGDARFGMVKGVLTATSGGLGRVEIRRNGVLADIVSIEEQRPGFESKIALGEGANQIEVIAFNKSNLISSQIATRTVNGPTSVSRTGTLHVLAAGIADYADRRLRLLNPSKDAQAIASAFAARGAGLFSNVAVRTLLDADVTRDRLHKEFAQIAAVAQPEDTVVVYFAGHGVTVEGRYHFLPHDFRYADEAATLRNGISQNSLQSWMAAVPALHSLLIYDTCESGSATKDAAPFQFTKTGTAAVRLSRAVGRTIFAAALDDAPAADDFEGHGLFTAAVLRSLSNPPIGKQIKNSISAHELGRNIAALVPELSSLAGKARQIPVVQLVGSDFPLATRTGRGRP